MKCPCCGYTDEVQYNPSKKIRELRSKRSRTTKKLLRKVSNFIQTNIPSDNSVIKEYQFLQGISHINDDTIDWAVNRYLENKAPVFAGKGFRYLSAIILNHHKNKDRVSEHERLMIGKPPSIVKLKEE